jgi:hypothetical protein
MVCNIQGCVPEGHDGVTDIFVDCSFVRLFGYRFEAVVWPRGLLIKRLVLAVALSIYGAARYVVSLESA